MSDRLGTLEQQLHQLRRVKIFDESVRAGAERIIASLPSPEDVRDPSTKVRILILRCDALLLLPSVSKEAEKDVHAALKLKQASPDMWVSLAECLLRRNAFQEACDALDNALRETPTDVTALCKYSQIQRNRCGESGVTPSQKTAYLEDAVDKARMAVQSNVNDSEAWNALSLSLLSKVTAEGMSSAGARKALSAMQQARNHCDDDPDIFYNKAVLESLCGNFGNAVADFLSANSLDSKRLKGTRNLCSANLGILMRAISRMKNATGIGRGEFKKTLAKLSMSTPPGSSESTSLAVVDVISESTMQPLVVLTTDSNGDFSFLLFYLVNSTPFKIGSIVTLPAPTMHVEVHHKVPSIPFLESAPLSLNMKHYFGDANSVLVNGSPLPSHCRVPVQVSSRLFA